MRVHGSETRKWRPLPLQTVEFQKLAAQKLRIDSSVAMDIAEKLYESTQKNDIAVYCHPPCSNSHAQHDRRYQRGLLSYPRTETDQFPPNFDFDVLIREQTDHPSWGSYASRLLASASNVIVWGKCRSCLLN